MGRGRAALPSAPEKMAPEKRRDAENGTRRKAYGHHQYGTGNRHREVKHKVGAAGLQPRPDGRDMDDEYVSSG